MILIWALISYFLRTPAPDNWEFSTEISTRKEDKIDFQSMSTEESINSNVPNSQKTRSPLEETKFETSESRLLI